jgi:hypothetical protein
VSLVTNYSFFMLFVLAILAAAIPAIAQSKSKQAKAPPALQSAAAETGLHFSVENRGLHSLSFNGQSLRRNDEPYRRAMLAADLAIADSGLMVLMWRLLRRKTIGRVSGLRYLQHLVVKLKGEESAEIFWVLPSARARQKLLDSAHREGFATKIDNCYVAPQYGLEIEDRHLLALVEQHRPAHAVIAVGSGRRESSDIISGRIYLIGRRFIASALRLALSQAIRLEFPAGPIAFISAGCCGYLRSHTSSCHDSGGRVTCPG